MCGITTTRKVKVNKELGIFFFFFGLFDHIASTCADLRFSCSICCMELDLWRVCGAGGAVGRCHVVVLLTWST